MSNNEIEKKNKRKKIEDVTPLTFQTSDQGP